MSNDITKVGRASQMVMTAIETNIGTYIKRSPDESTKDMRQDASKNLQALLKWQIANDLVLKDGDDKTYKSNPEALNSMSQEQLQEGAALYDAAVESQTPLMADLYMAGHSDYVEHFSEVHKQIDTSAFVPEMRPTDASLDNVTKASLTFLAAIEKNPSSLSNYENVTQEDVVALQDSLADAGYLLPGENPERKTPISEQDARGTVEQRMAIFTAASNIAINMDTPESVSGLDMTVLSAKQLSEAVAGAEEEEVGAKAIGSSELTPVNSDFQKEDISALYMTSLVAANMRNRAQLSTDLAEMDPENPIVVVPPMVEAQTKNGTKEVNIFDTLQEMVDYVDDQGITKVLQEATKTRVKDRGNRSYGELHVPGLAHTQAQTLEVAKALYGVVETSRAITSYVHAPEDEYISGDAGGESLRTVESEEEKENSSSEDRDSSNQQDMGDDFDRDIDLDNDFDTNADASENSDSLIPDDRRVPEKLMERLNKHLDVLSSMGALTRMSEMVGRDKNNDQEIFTGDSASYVDMEDFAQQQMELSSAQEEFPSDIISKRAYSEKSSDAQEGLRRQQAVFIEPGQGFLKGQPYESGAANVSANRVRNYVQSTLSDEGDPKQKLLLRSQLRKMSERPIIAASLQEGLAWRQEAQAFVEREAQEFELRKQAADEKAGLWAVSVSRQDLTRAVQVASATGNDSPFKITLNDRGGFMARDDAPRLSLAAEEGVPEEVKKTMDNPKTGRQLGGMISLESMRSALESMGDKETKAKVVLAAESPRGVISEATTARQRALEAEKKAKPRGLEPDLGDQL